MVLAKLKKQKEVCVLERLQQEEYILQNGFCRGTPELRPPMLS